LNSADIGVSWRRERRRQPSLPPRQEDRVEFSADEIERYARHLVMPDIGGAGQQKLKRASLLVIGAGGLGVPVLSYCAAAGVGRIGVVDHDDVSLANLQRQVLYRTADIGQPKALRAGEEIAALNPNVEVETFQTRASPDNIASLVAGYDIVADCTDNADARYAISDACFHAGKTLVTAAVMRMDGNVTTLKPHARGADGEPNPTYRCLFPNPPADGAAPVCAELGVLGVMTGLLGCIQALEVIKELAGIGSSLVGRLLLVDGRDLRIETIDYRWNPENALNGKSAVAVDA
jgi:molybdopterin/thiamine biosynthesis adenylyltransferase